MITELESILDNDLVTIVFLSGSAILLIASLTAATWLCETTHSRASRRNADAACLKLAPRRS